jgi:hypothetical protein
VAALLDQLRQLHADLKTLVDRDPEQEVTGTAIYLIDDVISEARSWLPEESTLRSQVREIISVDSILSDEPLRAADALLVVGQLLAAIESYSRAASESELSDATQAVARVMGARRRRAVFINPDDAERT